MGWSFTEQRERSYTKQGPALGDGPPLLLAEGPHRGIDSSYHVSHSLMLRLRPSWLRPARPRNFRLGVARSPFRVLGSLRIRLRNVCRLRGNVC